MKLSPDEKVSPEIATDSGRITDWLKGLVKRVHEDFENRANWVQAREHFFARRYCLEGRNPSTPWVGSSNIVLPLIDKKIDELKPQYVNMIVAARPPVTCKAVRPQYQKKVRNVELLFDWLVHEGSPRFTHEMIMGDDDCLETGRAIVKTYWRYETRQAPGMLTSARLPGRLQPLIVSQRDEQHANQLFAQAGGPGGAAIVLTRREFDRMSDPIREVVKREFDLDEEEPRDRKAITGIMAWLRGGAKGELKFESRDTVLNVPAIRAVSGLDFVVPENATDDIEEHERFVEIMYLTSQQLRAATADQKLNKTAVDHLIQKRKKGGESDNKGGGPSNWQRNMMEIREASREGTSGAGNNDLFEIWKCCTRLTEEAGGRDEKVIALIAADSPEAPLKIKKHSRPSGNWGYSTYTFELNKRRWYAARGVPEKLDDIEAEITAQHRAKLNRMAIVTTPTIKYRPGKHINPNTMKFFPGQMWPTNDPHNDVMELQFAQLDPVFDSEVQFLRTFCESYLGGPDYGITGNSNLTESRTATEINSINSQARQSLSMRGLLKKLAYDQVWREFFDMWHTMGPDEVYIQVTGGDEPLRLTKEELQGQFLLQCTGTIGSSDPVMEAQKAQNRLALLAQIQNAGLLGMKYELDLGEAIRDWLEKDDIRLSKLVLRERSPQEIKQMQQEQQQAKAQQAQQELAMAAAGSKPKANKNGAAPQGRPGIAALPPIGARN
jgi:hypothetical protein